MILIHVFEVSCDTKYPIYCCFRDSLADNGIIIVKENVTSSGKVEKDEADSSITRSLKQYLKIFKCANLKRIKQCKQTNFPSGIYPVYMFALIPQRNNDVNKNCSIEVKDMCN